MDAGAKQQFLKVDAMGLGLTSFPLEPIVCFVGREKMTTGTGDSIRFWAHQQLAREAMVIGKISTGKQFDLIAWEMASQGLHGHSKNVPALGMQTSVGNCGNKPPKVKMGQGSEEMVSELLEMQGNCTARSTMQ